MKTSLPPGPPDRKITSLPPGPSAVELTGLLIRKGRNLALFGRELFARYGGIVRLQFGPKEIYLVGQHEYAEYVLKDRSDHFVKGGKFWAGTVPIFGNGLAISEGEFWLRQRRLMQPLFSKQRYTALSETMISAISDELQRWPASVTSEPLDIKSQIYSITMRILLRSIFATDVQPSELEEVAQAANVLWSNMHYLSYGSFLPKWLNLPGKQRCLAALRIINQFIFKTIERRRHSEQKFESGSADLLSQLLSVHDDESRNGMTDQQVRDEAVTMLLSGFEITAAAVTWSIYQLCRSPQVESKVRAELDRVIGSRVPTFADLAQLPYTRMFISETLRLYSPGWMTFRSTNVEEEIGGYRIPKDSVVAISIDAVHHDPAVWPRPDEFEPERFAADNSASYPRSAFIPFGIGAHRCIGNNFALIEITLVLIMLLQRYRIQLAKPGRIESLPAAVQQPRGEVLVRLAARQAAM